MQLPTFETIEFTGPDDDGVVTLLLNRPDARNAINEQMHAEICEVVHFLQNPRDVGAVLVTGAGKGFCAGGDFSLIEKLNGDETFAIHQMEKGVHLAFDWLRIRPPVVAAINGHAMGLGATLALLSDVVVMDAEARIADTHVRAGIVAGDGGTLIWPALLGPNLAKEFLMTGNQLDAERAHQIGLVNHVTPAGGSVEKAREIARQLAQGPRHAIAWTKNAVNVPLLSAAALQMPLAIAQEARTMAQPDAAEGTAAFAARRAPQWPSAARAI